MKTVSDYTEQFDSCLMNEPAFCTAACPFNLDVRSFTEKIKQGRLSSAYKQFRDAVVFPEAVLRLCDRPCENACPLGEIDHAIDLNSLERLVCENAPNEPHDSYNLPPRGKRVCIIGAGLSGLACALKLAQKKYDVTVFEMSKETWSPAAEAFAADLARQFLNEQWTLQTGRRIIALDEVLKEGFDAIYLATGADYPSLFYETTPPELQAFSSLIRDAAAMQAESLNILKLPAKILPHSISKTQINRAGLSDPAAKSGVCIIAGGALIGSNNVYAIADGIVAAGAIDSFLRTGILKSERPPSRTDMVLAPVHIERYLHRKAEDCVPYTSKKISEAERCLACRCDACMIYADLPSYTGKWPPRIRDEVFVTTLPGKAEVKATPAKRLINTANLSGILKQVCPVGIDMDALLLTGRQSMHRQNKMPWSFHEFWLRDMEHANCEAGFVLDFGKANHEIENCRPLAFFPGCQLSAASPGVVSAAWEELAGLKSAGIITLSGFLQRCCGAPAKWAGDVDLFAGALDSLKADWETLGRPILVCACPSCMRIFAEHLPDIETVSIYEVLNNNATPRSGKRGADFASKPCSGKRNVNFAPKPPATMPIGTCTIFDPCAAAHLQSTNSVKQSVRDLAQAMGLDISPLPLQESVNRCCGFGGQPECADPGFVKKVREDRAAESNLPYICYCMNCREAFLKTGKEAVHILELRYGITTLPELSPSGRRENRMFLRERFTAKSTDESAALSAANSGTKVDISSGVVVQMDEDLILNEDVIAIINRAQSTGDYIIDEKSKSRSASLMIGRTTYWVCYTCDSKIIKLTAAYAHRLAIEREPVWNPLGNAPSESGMIHASCSAPLIEMEVEFSYLGRSFRHKALRCPVCGYVYITEDLARGRMRQVEMSLEDK